MAYANEVSITFDDVAVYFSEDEWRSLEESQKVLYRNVTKDNYQTLLSLGLNTAKPSIVQKIERGEDPCFGNSCEIDKSEIGCGILEDDGLMGEGVIGHNYEDPVKPEDDSLHVDQPNSRHYSDTSGVSAGDGLQESFDSDGGVTALQQQEPQKALECEDTSSQKPPATRSMKAYRRDGKFICNGCGKTFRHKSHCIAHERIHTGEKPFSCTKCGKTFRWVSQWKHHQTRICKSVLKSHADEELNDEELHSEKLTKKVETSSVTSGEAIRVFTHLGEQKSLRDEENPKTDVWSCDDVGRPRQIIPVEQMGIWTRKQARTAVEGSYNGTFCTPDLHGYKMARLLDCGSSRRFFRHKSHPIDRKQLHMARENRTSPVTCKNSEKSCHQNSVIHEKSYTEYMHECTDCGEMYSRSCDLDVHKKVHAGEPPLTCSECGNGFMTLQGLKAHQTCHAGNLMINRDMQVEALDGISQWRAHMQCHTEEPPYACMLCGKSFSQNSDLISHKKSHKKKQECSPAKKPFECPECGAFFVSKSGLVSHQLYITKAHECTECGERFHHIFGLEKHQITHTSLEKESEIRTLTTGDHLLLFSDPADPCLGPPALVENLQISVMLPEKTVLDDQWDKQNHEKIGVNPLTLVSPGEVPLSRILNENHPEEGDMKQRPLVSRSADSKDSHEESKCQEQFESLAGEGQDTTKACELDASGNLIYLVKEKTGKGPRAENELGENCTSKSALLEHSGMQVDESHNPHMQTRKTSHSERTFTPEQGSSEGGDTFICCECGESFQESSHLCAHEKVHMTQFGGTNPVWHKSFTCEKCGESFQWESQWTEHQRCHSVERTVICTECGENIHYTYSPLEQQGMKAQANTSPDADQRAIEYLYLLQHLKTCTSKPYTCPDCGKSFKLKESLVIHQKRSHTGEQPYNCPRCEMSFARRHQFRTHYKTHRGEQPFMCYHCGKSFKGMQNLSKHQRMHAEIGEACPKEVEVTMTEGSGPFQMEENKEGQMDSYTETLKYMGEALMHGCIQEQYTGEYSVHLESHNTFSGDFMNDIPLCDVGDQSQESWHHSEWRQGQMTSKALEDSIECESGVSHQTTVTSYQKTHLGKGPHSASEHLGNTHSVNLQERDGNSAESFPFMGRWCGKSFLWKPHLIAYERIHTGDEPFLCEECGEGFRLHSQWIEHRRSHDGDRAYGCSECGQSFHNSYTLLKHQTVHALADKSPCSDSDLSSLDLLKLHEHLNMYSSKKPFQCDECGKSFKLHESLVLHQKRSHTGEKPYNCPKCEMTFARRHQFRTHYKIHQGERPLQCVQCGRSFKGKLYFLRHQRIHAGEMLQSTRRATLGFPEEEAMGFTAWQTELSVHEANTYTQAASLSTDLMNTCIEQEHSGSYSVKDETCSISRQFTDEVVQHSEGDEKEHNSGCEGSVNNQEFVSEPQGMLNMDNLHTVMDNEKVFCGEIEFVNPENEVAEEIPTAKEFLRIDNSHSMHIETGGSPMREEYGRLISNPPVFPSQIIQVEGLQTGLDSEENILSKRTWNKQRRVYTGGGPFNCSGCGKSFRWRSHFIAHERIHTGEKPFTCGECGKSFRWSSQWIDHQRSHTGERAHMCTECGESFHHGYALQKHQRIHSQGDKSQCLSTEHRSDSSHCVADLKTLAREKPYACSDCGKRFKLRDSLVIHQRKVHTGERPYICTKCEKSFARRHQLRSHYKMHREERPFPCIQCGKYFRGRSQLIGHLRTHTAKVSKPSLADLPTKEEKRDLVERSSDKMQEHMGNIKTTAGAGDMNRDLKEEDPKRNPIKQKTEEIISGEFHRIPQCSEGDTRYGNLFYSLMQPQKPVGNDQNECNTFKAFPEDAKLGSTSQISSECVRKGPKKVSVIPRRFHAGNGPFFCSGCGKRFQWKSHLIAHERIHTGEKPFTCSECGRSFRWSSQWVEHQRTHTGEKPFVCMDCGKTYNRSCDLSIHKRVHTGERPYRCDCGKSFIAKKRLIMHQKIHEGERKRACADCGESFHHSYALLKHQRIHASGNALQCSERENSSPAKLLTLQLGTLPYVCIECGQNFKLQASLIIHQRRIHTGEQPFSCTKCEKSFTRRHQLRTHYKVHRKERPLQHVQDGQSSKDRLPRLDIHQETCRAQVSSATNVKSHGEDGLVLKKGPDLISLADDGSLEKAEEKHPVKCSVKLEHLKSSLDVTDVSLCLKACDAMQLERQKRPISPAKCEGGFSNKSTVLVKIQTEEDLQTETGSLGCSSMKGHFTGNLYANDGPPFNCSGCGKIFQWRSHFIAHKRIHTGEKPFTCIECGKSFRWSSQWNDHQKSHTGEKLYTCMECGKSFSDSSNLAIHKMSHLGKKLYTCDDCGKCFTQKQHLMLHQRNHTRIKH